MKVPTQRTAQPAGQAASEVSGVTPSPSGGVVCRPVFVFLLLFVATVTLYVPVVGFDFINYDDPEYITENPQVQAGLTWDNVANAFQSTQNASWYPLSWLSFMADQQVFGPGPAGPHLTNLLLHSANSALLFWLLKRLTGATWRSAFVAGLFALHPLRVESVAWVSERKDVLSTFFGLIALIFYARYAQNGSKVEGRRSKEETVSTFDFRLSIFDYGFALVFLALALLSKPMVVTLPFVMLLLDYWPLQRLAIGDWRLAIWKLVLEKIPFFLLAAAVSAVTVMVHDKAGLLASVGGLPMSLRVQNAFVSYAGYLEKIFWPFNLALPYPHPGHSPVSLVVLGMAIVFAISLAAVWCGRRPNYVAVGWFWFIGTLIPVIGLLQWANQSIADRFTYLPSIGLFIVVAWGTGELAVYRPKLKWLLFGVGVLLIVACALRTRDQLHYWQNSGTLFRHTLAVTPPNEQAHSQLGCYLRDQGRLDAAIEQFHAGLKINPERDRLLLHLAYVLGNMQKKYAESIPAYQAALRVNPANPDIHCHYARMLAEMGKTDDAIEHYRETLRLNLEHVEAHNYLGIALAGQGKIGEALQHFQAAVRLKPDFAEAHCNLGNALVAQDKYTEAIAQYREALRLNPHYAHAENNLASALESSGQTNEAVGHYQAALKLDANAPMTHFNLGSLLAKLGRRDEAIAQLREAVRLKPDYQEAKERLRELVEASSQ